MEKTEVVIDGVVYSRKEEVLFKEGYVLVRTYSAGVHFGFLKGQESTLAGKEVVLTNAKRLWQWYGACSLSQVAVEGVKDKRQTKIPCAVAEITLIGVIEIIPLTETAFENLNSMPEWRED